MSRPATRLAGCVGLAAAALLVAPPSSAQTVFSCSKPDAIALARKLVRDHFQVKTTGGPFRIGNSWAEPERREELFLSWGIKQSSRREDATTSFAGANLVHLAFLGPYDYWLDWRKTGSGVRLRWCNYVIKAAKDKAQYMADNSYVFLSEDWKDAPAGTAQQRMTLSTRGRTSVDGVDIRDAVRITMLVVSPHSATGSGSSTVTITKKDASQLPP